MATKVGQGRWSLEGSARVAIGKNERTVVISGNMSESVPGPPSGLDFTYNHGFLASPTNIGRYVRDDHVVIPRFDLELGYQWNSHLRTYAGYSILYWANVMRAGDQIDLRIDTYNPFPPGFGTALPYPAFPGHTTHFWAQGINLGGELRY